MVHQHANVADISTISRFSPYLSLSLLLLTINIFFTIIGVSLNTESINSLDEMTVWSKYALFGLSLIIFLGACAIIMACKYCCLKYVIKMSKYKLLAGSLLFDILYSVMGTLYLAGDNLPIFICSVNTDAAAKEDCIELSSIFLGVSLLLNTALYVAAQLSLKPNDVPTFPVTGRIRKAYQSILKLVVLTIFVDQTFSTVVRFITNVDIEADETSTCGCVDNTTATNCLSLVNNEVGGFLGGLSAIILFIVVGLLVKNRKEYCSCCARRCSCYSCRRERNSNHNSYQDIDADRNEGEENLRCIMPHLYEDVHAVHNEDENNVTYKKRKCYHICENICIIVVYFLVLAFMGVYTLADNRWLWTCVAVPDPTAGRFSMLAIAFVFSLGWHAVYVWIICLPGVGIVLGNKKFFSEYEYVTVEASRDNSEWVAHKRIRAYGPADPPRDANLQNPTHPNELTESSTSITIEEGHGSVSISLPIEDETTLKRAYQHIKKTSTCCTRTDQCDGCTACCGWLKNKCKKCKCDKRSASKDKEMIMFAYLGKKENIITAMFEYMDNTMQSALSTAKLSADRTLDISEIAQRYPNVTQFYVVPKPSGDPSQRTTTATNEPEDTQSTPEASGGFQVRTVL